MAIQKFTKIVFFHLLKNKDSNKWSFFWFLVLKTCNFSRLKFCRLWITIGKKKKKCDFFKIKFSWKEKGSSEWCASSNFLDSVIWEIDQVTSILCCSNFHENRSKKLKIILNILNFLNNWGQTNNFTLRNNILTPLKLCDPPKCTIYF